jgi:hypothetical protein
VSDRAAHNGPVEIAIALAGARRDVDARRKRREAHGDEAGEELQTYWLLDAARPRIEYAQFNRAQEGVVGADWLWWFLDDSGECFGVLIQAKKLYGSVGNRKIDLEYPRGTRGQMKALFAAADHFDVPCAYILYCGDHQQRVDLECGAHDPPYCPRCACAGVSVLSGLGAETAVNFAPAHQRGQLAIDAYRYSMPLEEMVQPATDAVFDVNLDVVSAELREFLTGTQDGARGVAKQFFTAVAEIRTGQLAAPGVELLRRTDETVFDALPADVGHFGRPYYDHILRGLRRSLPEYVTNLVLQGGNQVPDGIDGIVIVHL